jgi:hypothetical protein
MSTLFDTHAAVQKLKEAEERTESSFRRLVWMIGFNIALTVLVLAKLFS